MSTASTFEREMLELINQERTSRGLNPVQLETRLNDSSEDHSVWMLNTDTFSHTGSGGSSATQRMENAGFDFSGSWRSGENIAWQSERGAPGISDDVAQLHQNLMNSPGHRANILNPDFEYVGIGIETGDMQGFDAVMVTQNFAATDAAVVLDNGNSPTRPAPTPPNEEVAEPEEPEAETPETDVTIPEEPATDVTETEEPEAETPDTDVAEPNEPETDVTETDEQDGKTPKTEVTETEEPKAETPETEEPATDITETEEPETETPETEVTETAEPANGCFNIQEFLAAIEDFRFELQAFVDQLDWNKTDTAPSDIVAETNIVDEFITPRAADLEDATSPEEFALECVEVDELDFRPMQCDAGYLIEFV